MNRRDAVNALMALGFAPLTAKAQPAGKVFRIGYLLVEEGEQSGFFLGVLKQLGYVDGQNAVLEIRSAKGQRDRLPELAAELVRLKVDVIVALSTIAARPAKEATKTLPIVMLSGDPVGTGLVTSLGRPGGNVTGVATFSADAAGKRLELLKAMIPALAQVAVLWDPDGPAKVLEFKQTEIAAKALRIELQSLEVRAPNPDFRAAVRQAANWRAGALFVLGNSLTGRHARTIVDLANKNRIASMYDSKGYVEVGGLAAYGPDFGALLRRAAFYVEKVLKGTKPGDLPVEQPTTFELVINLRTAKALGIKIPQSVLLRADRLIE